MGWGGGVEHRTIGGRTSHKSHGLGTTTATDVFDHEVGFHFFTRQVFDQLSQENVATAAGAGVRDQIDTRHRVLLGHGGSTDQERRTQQPRKDAFEFHFVS